MVLWEVPTNAHSSQKNCVTQFLHSSVSPSGTNELIIFFPRATVQSYERMNGTRVLSKPWFLSIFIIPFC